MAFRCSATLHLPARQPFLAWLVQVDSRVAPTIDERLRSIDDTYRERYQQTSKPSYTMEEMLRRWAIPRLCTARLASAPVVCFDERQVLPP